MYQIKGRFLRIANEIEFTARSGATYTRADMIVDCTDTEWQPNGNGRPNICSFSLFGRTYESAVNITPNTPITINFNIEGHEYTNKDTGEVRVFTSLEVVNIDRATNDTIASIPMGQPTSAPAQQPAAAPQGYAPQQGYAAPAQAQQPPRCTTQPTYAPQPAPAAASASQPQYAQQPPQAQPVQPATAPAEQGLPF